MNSEVGYVYMITSPTNRIYIGSTKNITDRKRKYKYSDCKSQPKLYNSIKKYGFENHIFEVIWKGNINNMLKYEHLIGVYYECLDANKGLNCKLPAYDDIRTIYSDEYRLRRRLHLLNFPMSKEAREKARITMTGKKQTEEAKLIRTINKKCKKVICTKTGLEFTGINQAAKYFNMNNSTLAQKLKGKRKNNTTLKLK